MGGKGGARPPGSATELCYQAESQNTLLTSHMTCILNLTSIGAALWWELPHFAGVGTKLVTTKYKCTLTCMEKEWNEKEPTLTHKCGFVGAIQLTFAKQ